jgi:hypothetical protein
VFARVGKRQIDSALCGGHRCRSDGLLTRYLRARRERRPLPDAALNALNDRIFDASIFHINETLVASSLLRAFRVSAAGKLWHGSDQSAWIDDVRKQVMTLIIN